MIIEHPSGAEIQWDWDELGTCPWDASTDVSLLVSALSSFVQDEGVALLPGGSAASGGGYRSGAAPAGWHPEGVEADRMATVINPHTGKVSASFAPVAKHYGVTVVAHPRRYEPGRRASVP